MRPLFYYFNRDDMASYTGLHDRRGVRVVKWRLISRHSYRVQMSFVLCTGGVCTGKGRQPLPTQIVSVVGFCRTYSAPFRGMFYPQRDALGWQFAFLQRLHYTSYHYISHLMHCAIMLCQHLHCVSHHYNIVPYNVPFSKPTPTLWTSRMCIGANRDDVLLMVSSKPVTDLSQRFFTQEIKYSTIFFGTFPINLYICAVLYYTDRE